MSLRNVRWSKRFEAQVTRLNVAVRRLDDALDGATWAAARGPAVLPSVSGTDYRLLTTDPFPDLCALRIYLLIIDEDQVEFDAIECVDEDEDEPVL